jgi:16S rRNA (cytidine1402-2'-O)-methyltransferase
MAGKLYVIGTPIGNREDITLRAMRTLFSVEVLLCEDTRKTSKLLTMIYDLRLTIHESSVNTMKKPRLERFDENVERVKSRQVIAWLKEGKQIGLVTDAGMPGISDPGAYLVRQCYEKEISVEVIPGPSALTTAISLSGIPAESVLFLGFLPKKKGKRELLYEELRTKLDGIKVKPMIVMYESPHRVLQTLEELRVELADPEVAAMSELTKMHEKVLRGRASEVSECLPETLKGEWVVVVRL